MKKVVLRLNSAEQVKQAGKILDSLTGVMVTNIQDCSLVIHYGHGFDSNGLIQKLKDNGLSVSVVEEAPSFF